VTGDAFATAVAVRALAATAATGALAAVLAVVSATCATRPPPEVQRTLAAMDDAAALDDAGRYAEAAAAYERVPTLSRGTHGRDAARALVRAGQLRVDKLADPDGAERDFWQAIERYPDAAAADDGVRALVRLGRPRLRERLLYDAGRLAGTEVADNLRFAAAELAAPAAPAVARIEYEAIARDYPTGGLRDDALWRAAALARATRDPRGALEDLRLITMRRKQPLVVGSYLSVWLDDALLEAGRIWLEDLHDVPHAVESFEDLRDNFPDSTLRDDAQWLIASAYAQAGDRARSCGALARLRKQFADSHFARKEGAALAAQLGC
jgi:tetratricopeptide (TPR) repeat protein